MSKQETKRWNVDPFMEIMKDLWIISCVTFIDLPIVFYNVWSNPEPMDRR
jgi:hypothetical protein